MENTTAMSQLKLLVPAAICILAIALSVKLIPSISNDKDSSPASSPENTLTTTSADSRSQQETETKLERENQGSAQARRNLEKEFDELLPAQFPDQHSSLCDVNLEAGESLVLGGFKRSDGNYEFTKITVTPKVSEGNVMFYSIKAATMVLTEEKSSEFGYDALVSPAKTRIQKSLITSSGATAPSSDYFGFMSSPTIITAANQPGSISVGGSESAHVISTIAAPQGDGDSIRLRARIESPAGQP
jgi:hypothetical protein